MPDFRHKRLAQGPEVNISQGKHTSSLTKFRDRFLGWPSVGLSQLLSAFKFIHVHIILLVTKQCSAGVLEETRERGQRSPVTEQSGECPCC